MKGVTHKMELFKKPPANPQILFNNRFPIEQGASQLPFQVESEVSQDGTARQEGAAHAGEKVPVGAVCWAVGLGDVIGLFDQLTVHLISQ